ncbi:MAG: hypothetical protein C5B48_01875 [Candidatus Rokuibacteriota bacterium]|nr:MAG: hypothetical protein C5B48_01875 [Candidatus Rokubacteria bacterium]
MPARSSPASARGSCEPKQRAPSAWRFSRRDTEIWAPPGEGVKREIVTLGPTLQLAFAEAALATLALAIAPEGVRQHEVREVRAHGGTLEALCAHWIDECRYVQEIEGFGCGAIDFAVFDLEPKAGGEPLRIHAFLRGEVGAESDQPGQAFTALSARDIAIGQTPEGYQIRLTIES